MALKVGSRRFPKFRGACNVTWTPPQFAGRRAEWAGRAKRRDTEVTRDGAPESSVFRQSLISAWLESGALGGDLLPRCSTHPRCCLRRRRSKAQDGRQNARRIAEGQFKGSFLGISVSQRVFRCGLGPPETCGPRELTGVRAGGLLAPVGLAPLHQGAQVERPESARPSRPGFSPTLTCLGAVASGARPSFDFGVRPVVETLLRRPRVASCCARRPRGQRLGEAGRFPVCFSPSSPTFFISGLTSSWLLLGFSHPSREISLDGRKCGRGPPVEGPRGGTCGGSSSLCLGVPHVAFPSLLRK